MSNCEVTVVLSWPWPGANCHWMEVVASRQEGEEARGQDSRTLEEEDQGRENYQRQEEEERN